MSLVEDYNKLKNEVLYHRDLYEAKHTQEITDTQYDDLYFKLVDFEQKHPELKADDSPTQTVADLKANNLPKIKHKFPMLSLNKVKYGDETDLKKFLDKFNSDPLYKTDQFLVEHKEDGLTGVMYYNSFKNKPFVSATRGNGVLGEDVTLNVQGLSTVPTKLKNADGTIMQDEVIIRGESIIDDDDFDVINKDGNYRSPRNLVAGSIQTLDPTIAKKRNVKFLAYNIENADALGIETEEDMLAKLEEWGFTISNPVFFNNTTEGKAKLVKYIEDFDESKRKAIGHMIDGLVIKPNNITFRANVGNTYHHPKWAMAYKFKSEDAITKVLKIYWTVGKTGMVVPNALVEPVEISDSIIERASLANINNILKRDIRVGDDVVMIRSNDVIPQIISVIKENRKGNLPKVELPTKCPSCNATLSIEESEVKGETLRVPYCVNVNCPAQRLRQLENFVSKNGMDIDSLSIKTLTQLYDAKFIKDFVSIYQLNTKKEDLLKLDRFGKTKVNKLLVNIEASKQKGMYSILVGLSIKNIGKDVAKKLALTYSSLNEMFEDFAKDEDDFKAKLISIDGLGETIVATIVDDLILNKYMRTQLQNLSKLGVSLASTTKKVEIKEDAKITGKTFVITGALSKPRNEIKASIEALGGKVTGSVTKKTDYLIFGGSDTNTSKYKKAQQLGVKIVGEDFLD